jgi:hypothetical protein
MTQSRPQLQRALQNALASGQRSHARAVSSETREKLQQLIVSLEQALVDVEKDREAQVLGLTKWVADWIPRPKRSAIGSTRRA